MTTETPTAPENSDAGSNECGPVGASPDALALVVVWCRAEPERLGEVLVIPPGRPGPVRIFGRGPISRNDRYPRLQLVRDRPGGARPSPPLGIDQISRVQLELRALDASAVEVRNVGKCTLMHNGLPTSVRRLSADETLRLGKQLLFLCVRRPAWLPGSTGAFATTPFGGPDFAGMVGESQEMWRLRQALSFVGPQRGHVLVTGPSGAGKELAVRALHALSARAQALLVSRSAATLPGGIIDAELFGNAKNYPNPGVPERVGLIGKAHGGTLFLDEFASLSPALQAHLLRVLDAGEYHRLGESTSRRSDFRLVAATNRTEEELKQDLVARLPLRIDVRGLETRREDIPLIARHLLRAMANDNESVATRLFSSGKADGEPKISIEMMRELLVHRYTTHTRELGRLLWMSVEQSRGHELTLSVNRHSPLDAASAREPPLEIEASTPSAQRAEAADGVLTAEKIQDCLDRHNGVIEATWRALGLPNRHALARLIASYGIEVRRRPGKKVIRRGQRDNRT